MKNFILLILILMSSCGTNEIKKLNNRISELELQNSILKDSLAKVQYQKLTTIGLVVTPKEKNYN